MSMSSTPWCMSTRRNRVDAWPYLTDALRRIPAILLTFAVANDGGPADGSPRGPHTLSVIQS